MVTHKGLDAWKVARELFLMVLRVCRDARQPWAAELLRQASRASLSVQLNFAEGYAYGHTPTRLHHYRIAYGSAVEAGELCDHLVDSGIVGTERAEALLTLSRRSRELCWAVIRAERRTEDRRGKTGGQKRKGDSA